eukprot:COSAG01_NODE_74234_length_221_cov_607.000000_1_plen_49_part_10
MSCHLVRLNVRVLGTIWACCVGGTRGRGAGAYCRGHTGRRVPPAARPGG